MLLKYVLKQYLYMFDDDPVELFERNINRMVAEKRKNLGLTQEKLAARLECDRRDLQRWETVRAITTKTLFRLSIALECKVTDFFKTPRIGKPKSGRPRKKKEP